eukprot:CAMPEP_0118660400 /NCGR_PEP_ID=MMETSP0785-20121206/15657_1 /TAXON_ID=91992 /ORGANISM="Bolidomonas pacifica, Strain CCMP 1866" /LENGTH=59 /DNA_ID=CAMNT_0006553633 /DNA_START=41 /DNA_END=217 /DNA_ORIENTATION=-
MSSAPPNLNFLFQRAPLTILARSSSSSPSLIASLRLTSVPSKRQTLRPPSLVILILLQV